MFLNDYKCCFILYDQEWNSVNGYYKKIEDMAVTKYKKDIKSPEYSDIIYYKIMKVVLFAKFAQNKELCDALLATNNAELYCENIFTKDFELCNDLMSVRECIRRFSAGAELGRVSRFSEETIV